MENMEVFPLESEQARPEQKPFLNKTSKLLENEHSAPQLRELQKLLNMAANNLPAQFFENYTPGDFLGLLEYIHEQLNAYGSESTDQLDVFNPTPDSHGWDSQFTVVNLVARDLPFIVDSLHENLNRSKLDIRHMFYSDFTYTYEAEKNLTRLAPETDEPSGRLFLLNIQLNRQPEEKLSELKQQIQQTLSEIELAVSDFQAMTDRASEIKDKLGTYEEYLPEQRELLDEAGQFLEFVMDENFVFLGFRKYELKEADDEKLLQTVEDSNLGIMKQDRFKDYPDAVPLDELEFRVQERITSRMVLTVKKTEVQSRVYRSEQLDHITVKSLDSEGEISGEYQFVGLFTDRVLNEPAVNVPLLRKKFQDLLDRENISKHTHLYRDVYTIFNNMPKHLLFMSPVDDLAEDIRAVVEAYGETGFKLRVRPDAYHQGLTVMVVLSRTRYNEAIGQEIKQELKAEFEPEGIDYRVTFGESDFVQLHYYLQTERRNPRSCSFEELEQQLQELTRSWSDRLNELISENFSREEARELAAFYPEAFPGEYQTYVRPETALRDIRNLEKLREPETDSPVIDLTLKENTTGESQLILYSHRRIKLNEIMPMLSNHGLEILEQSTFKTVIEDREYYLHLFSLEEPRESGIEFDRRRELLLQSIKGVYNGIYRDDLINELIIHQGLTPRALNLFRLYKNYFHQINPAIKLESINKAITNYPRIAAELFRHFEIKFDPNQPLENREAKLEEHRAELAKQLDKIDARNDYYILNTLLNLTEATVRTNYYQEECGKSYISVKIQSEVVRDMPDPRPLFEIYVYSTVMEAIHLRHSKIARGGIRWSDRRDDFRTEVLGLAKTQQVKNALIVPGGSKGGFVLKSEHLGEDKPLANHAREQYRVFMHGMLDVTDNLVDGEVKPPEDVICYDEPDPYLVVAADKGTATFSDTANEVSQAHDYWLDDAFATGGSTGYDHKELGITARGGWECVKRHFRELGQNIQEEPFTVVGIGDMGGDVFGNGMLLSDQIKLVGAFNHKHIFINPEPDPETTFQERQRLYENEAGWDEYDRSILSDGGEIYDRDTRKLELSEPARELLGLETAEPAPETVIKALLKLDVDLLWNGGIGTYIKATEQPHAAAGDPANDSCRVDASEVQSSVIGEGGNLGITQEGRIELDRRGVKLNTDAIDNSGGVDLSDHEVNIKILLQESIKHDELDPENRLEVLEQLPENLIDKVTANNYFQSGVISLESFNSEQRLDAYRHLLNFLEDNFELNREVEALPDESEMLERIDNSLGMTRPELAVLLSYVKMYLYDRANQHEWDDEWVKEPFLKKYFPAPLINSQPRGLENHPLDTEVALTALVNHLVDNCGITFFFRLHEETGAPPRQIINCFLAADRLANGEELRSQLRDFEAELTAEDFYQTWWEIIELLGSTVLWLHESITDEYTPETFLDEFGPRLTEKQDEILDHLDPARQERVENKRSNWREKGLSEDFNEKLSKFYYLLPSLDVLLVQEQTGADLQQTARLYFELGTELNIDWLMNRLLHQRSEEHWEQLATSTLAREINTIQRHLVTKLLEESTSLEEFCERNDSALEQLNSICRDLSGDRKFNFSGFQFYVQHLRHLE